MQKAEQTIVYVSDAVLTFLAPFSFRSDGTGSMSNSASSALLSWFARIFSETVLVLEDEAFDFAAVLAGFDAVLDLVDGLDYCFA